MNTKKIALTLGLMLIFITVTVLVFQWALTIEKVQMPFVIERQQAIIYRKEFKDYKYKQMYNKATQGLEMIDQFEREYPPTPTPTPKEQARGEIVTKSTTVAPIPKYLTNDGSANRGRALAWIQQRWSGDDVTAFDNILKKESGYRADAVNEIGAGGICQAYPASKMGCNISNDDLMCQLEWCNSYIISRYETPSKAYGFHVINNWF